MQKLPGKEQGELLMLRSAFEKQAKELATLRSAAEHQRVQELEREVASFEQQKNYFMEEILRLKKLVDDKSQSRAPRKFSWFGSGSNESPKDIVNKGLEPEDLDETEKESSSSSWWAIS